MNQNVLFEFGYALGKGRRTVLLRDEGRTGKTLDFLQDVREVRYENVGDIFKQLSRNDPFDERPLGLDLMRSANECDDQWSADPAVLRILYIKGGSRAQAAMSIEKALKRLARQSSCHFLLDDPAEDIGHPLYSLWRRISGAHIVVSNLAPHDEKRRDEMNARACLLTGMALAFGKHVVVLQGKPSDHLIDLRPILREYADASEAQRLVRELSSLLDTVKAEIGAESRPGPIQPRRARRRAPLDLVTFGNAAAENEVEDLASYFVQTVAYDEADSGRRVLFSGRQGSGKTAVCEALRSNLADRPNRLCAQIWPEGLDLERFAMTVESKFGPDVRLYAFELAWRYVIYTELAGTICKDYMAAPHLWDPPSVEPLRDFCEQEGILQEKDLNERLEGALQGAQREVNPAQEWTPEGKLAQVFHGREIAALEQMLSDAVMGKDIYVLVDNLDKHWHVRASDRTACKLVLGLLAEAQRIGRTEFSGHVHPVIFVRDDVRRSVESVDPEEGKKDWMQFQWDAESLKHLIAERIRASLSPRELGRVKSDEELWSTCFCPTVLGVPTSDYFIARNLMVPRHLIWFCTTALDLARQRGHSVIEAQDVLDAEKQYSSRLRRSVTTEFGNSDLDLSVLSLWFEGVAHAITESDVANRICQWAGEARVRVTRELVERAKSLLYESGILTLEVPDGAIATAGISTLADAQRFAWRAYGLDPVTRKPGPAQRVLLSLHLVPRPRELSFQVHPGFEMALGVRVAGS